MEMTAGFAAQSSFPLSLSDCLKPSLFLEVLNPHRVPKNLICSLSASGCLNPPAVVVSILESFSYTAVHIVHSRETSVLCVEMKLQDFVFFYLKGVLQRFSVGLP